MTSSRQIVERRIHKRFQFPKDLFAMLRPGYSKMGSIVDMSMSGLAFRYIDRGESSHGTLIDIFMIGHVFHLHKVPVRTISNVEVVDGTPSSYITIRRCGVQFRELTDNQMSELAHFIQNYATGEA